MVNFDGFLPGKPESILIPQGFSSELLPQIDDLAELKLVLFCFRALSQREGKQPYLCYQDFVSDDHLMQGLKVIQESDEPETTLKATLDKMIQHSILLPAEVTLDGKQQTLYFVNTPRGRGFIEQIKLGNWKPTSNQHIEILPERPNIFALYEANIGPLTGMIVDKLKDAAKEYEEERIREAIEIAVENNARSWRYIQTILKRWQEEGKQAHAASQQVRESGNLTKHADIIQS